MHSTLGTASQRWVGGSLQPSTPLWLLSRQSPTDSVLSVASLICQQPTEIHAAPRSSPNADPRPPKGQARRPCGTGGAPSPTHLPSLDVAGACASSSAAQTASSAAPGRAWSNRTVNPLLKATESKFISENAINKYPLQPDIRETRQTCHSH